MVVALRNILGIACVTAVLIAPISAAAADDADVADFYRDGIVSLYIGYPPGGGYDVYGRVVAHHIGRFIPGNPTVVPINMEGAGSLRLANWLYNAAPRDGTAFGIINHGVPFEPLLGSTDFAQFDPLKFTWIGSANEENVVCVAWHTSNVTKLEDLYDEEFIIGGTGPGADDFVFPKLLSGVLGVPLRFVTGYAGGNDLNFAIERGEVEGRCGWTWSGVKSTRQYWLDDGSISVFLQLGLERHPDLPDVPLILDYAKNDEERQMLRLIMMRGVLGRPFLAPPELPPERAEALIAAFDQMIVDPAFLDEAARARLDIVPASGAKVRGLLEEAYRTTPALIERTRALLR
jgi:tripartite-type tricarboxylate transporter receptor subunit TctC